MAGKDEEEDDEGFGDFKFVSSTAAVSSNPSAASNGVSGDCWGDFLSFNAPPRVESTPKPPPIQDSAEPFGFFADRVPPQRSPEVASAAGAVPEKPKWVKPSGAIPLSLFGEEEDEEERSGPVGSSANGVTFRSDHSNGDPAKKAHTLSSAGGLNDLLANLYNQNKDSVPSANGSSFDLTSNGGKDAGVESQAELNSKPSLNGFYIDASNGNEEEDNEDEWEDEWEFRAADAEARAKGDNLNGDLGKGKTDSGLNFNNDFPSWNGFFSNLNGFSSESNGAKLGSNGFSSDLNGFGSKNDGVDLGSNGFKVIRVEKQEDPEDDFGWGFKGADVEGHSKEGNFKVEGNTRENFEVEPSFDFGSNVLEPTEFGVARHQNPQILVADFAHDLYLTPGSQLNISLDSTQMNDEKDVKNDSSLKSGFGGSRSDDDEDDDDEWDFKEASLDINPSNQDEPVLAKNGTTSTPISTMDAVLQSGTQDQEDPRVVNGVMSNSNNGNMDSGGDLWGFRDAFSDSNLNNEGNEENQNKGKEPIPLSAFGDEELEDNGSLTFPHLPTTNSLNESIVRKQPSSLSINDLIASLYSEAAPTTSAPDMQMRSEIELGTSKTKLDEGSENELEDSDESWDFKAANMKKEDASQASFNLIEQLSDSGLNMKQSSQESRLMYSDNVLDDSSWGFQNASSGLGNGDDDTLPSFVDPRQNVFGNVQTGDLLDFYSKLKDEVCLLALSHLLSMKQAHGIAGSPGEDPTLEAQIKEIQELYNRLNSENSISEVTSVDLPIRAPQLKGFLPTLNDKLQVLEAEYQLSWKLSLAEGDPKSLIDLLRHVFSMLRILRWGTLDQQHHYVSTWSKLISLCTEELKHGALLWKLAFEKGVQDQLLFKSEAKKYIIALGEIYRAVGVLRASSKLYKPWLLFSSSNFSAAKVMMDECTLVWSTSGLEEVLASMSDPMEFPYDGTVAALLTSIRTIHGLDEYALQTYNFDQEECLCRISLLSTGLVGDLKIIKWDGEEYFLKLGNLWANLVSCNPPDLPRMEIGC